MARILNFAVAALALLHSANASMNPLSVSRTAMLKSVRKTSHVSDRSSSSSSSSMYSSSSTSIDEWYENGCDELLQASNYDNEKDVQLCSAAAVSSGGINPLVKNLARGAFLRVASDISGGTALENVKCRVTATGDGPFKSIRDITSAPGGILNLWSGTPSRTVEGALLGAIFLVGSAGTKKQALAMGAGKNMAALAGGIVGGVAQAVVMTPAGMVFTSLNVNKGKPGYENDNAIIVAKRIIKEKGIQGMFVGGNPMAVRQASNWASRGLFTELCRTNLKMSRFGLIGEIGSGVIGGLGSCWNTPIETVRVLMQRDVSMGLPPKTFGEYIDYEMEQGGVPSLFRGVTPRAVQAVWQTVFMVVVPNLLGL
jgi:phage shock protein PspC (stress-responsive transcriptional regulator)